MFEFYSGVSCSVRLITAGVTTFLLHSDYSENSIKLISKLLLQKVGSISSNLYLPRHYSNLAMKKNNTFILVHHSQITNEKPVTSRTPARPQMESGFFLARFFYDLILRNN